MDGRFDDPNDLSLDSSSSGEEDEDAEMAEPILDDFLSMIPKLAEHDPEIYEKDKTYFPPEIEVEEKEKGPQKVTYKDMARRNILDRVARGDDAGSDLDEDEALEEHRKKASGLSYAQEQELAKKEMLAAVWGDTDSGDDEEADEAGLIKIKSASEQKKKMEEELADTGRREPKKPSTSILNYWTRKDLDADELFLRDYVLNKRWMGVGDTGSMKRTDLELVNDDEDTKELEKQDDFETAYNFRYEDPNGHQLVSHARSQPESVRVETNKRADARARKRERKRLEKQAAEESKIEEKKKKKAEILARIGELTEASGLADRAKRTFREIPSAGHLQLCIPHLLTLPKCFLTFN
jgi:protein KRI1